MIIVHVHIRRDEEVAVKMQDGKDGKYAILITDNLSVFINSRERVLEIASQLEKSAQNWEVAE